MSPMVWPEFKDFFAPLSDGSRRVMVLFSRDGAKSYLWVDDDGLFRIGEEPPPPREGVQS